MTELSGLKELVPVSVDPAYPTESRKRINILLPSVRREYQFGGVLTAIRLFDQLRPHFELARIVSVDGSLLDNSVPEFTGWVEDQGKISDKSFIGLNNSTPKITLLRDDFFVASFWTTAILVRTILRRQLEIFGVTRRRYIYFIQEYDPAFYPWSIQHTYARSTYNDHDDAIAVFNSYQLHEFFDGIGLRFREQYVSATALHPLLRKIHGSLRASIKERLIVIYSRQGHRNAFDLIVSAIRFWFESDSESGLWSVVSIGDRHEDVLLGDRVIIRSIGKLSLEDYGVYLSRAWIGLAFMFTPHPCDLRIEMAEFCRWLITNKFVGNDISALSKNIVAMELPTPGLIAEKLVYCCSQFQHGVTANLANPKTLYPTEAEEFPYAKKLVRSLTNDSSDI